MEKKRFLDSELEEWVKLGFKFSEILSSWSEAEIKGLEKAIALQQSTQGICIGNIDYAISLDFDELQEEIADEFSTPLEIISICKYRLQIEK